MLWRIIQASMIFSRSPCSYRRAGRRKIQKWDCKMPKAHSTSFLAPFCFSAKSLCSVDYGWRIDFTKTGHSGYMSSAR
jgi:hypothetical protein